MSLTPQIYFTIQRLLLSYAQFRVGMAASKSKDWKKVKSAVTINAALGNIRCHNNIKNFNNPKRTNPKSIIFVSFHICHSTSLPPICQNDVPTKLFAQPETFLSESNIPQQTNDRRGRCYWMSCYCYCSNARHQAEVWEGITEEMTRRTTNLSTNWKRCQSQNSNRISSGTSIF